MKVYDKVQKLIAWWPVNQAVTVKQIVTAGVLNSRDASDAIRYGARHGAIERVKREGTHSDERELYRLTGQPLPVAGKAPTPPSFDELLSAWGIARVPPQLSATTSRKCEEAI